MMNQLYVIFLKPKWTLVVLMALYSSLAFANTTSIAIDNEAKALVAPEACSYQWYKNGNPLKGEINKNLSVGEAGTYTVEIKDEVGAVSAPSVTVAINATGAIIKIILIGDSTVAPAKPGEFPLMGWGHVFQYFFNSDNIKVRNFAIGGTSTKSFYARADGWRAAQREIAPGDYVFMQFGHNDQKDASLAPFGAYQEYLTRYINETKAKGGIPVLVTSVNRNLWNGTTLNTGSLGDFPAAVRQLGTRLKVPVVDLHQKTAALYTKLGQTYLSNYVFVNLDPGEYPDYPNGNSDKTHFREMGAIEISRLVVEAIQELSANADMKALTSSLVPLYELKVTANPANAATMTTRTASYPQGIPITLKTTPKSPNKFYNWNDEASKNVSTKLIYSFKMGNKATSYTAMYNNTVLDLNDEKVEIESTLYPNPFTNDFLLTTPGPFSYTLYTLEGIEIGNGNADNSVTLGNSLDTGIYLLRLNTQKGDKLYKIMKK